jgi:flagellar hook-length control protein FliK
MDTNLLTIDNMMFAGITFASQSISYANDSQFSQATDNTYPYSNTAESITTDKISTIIQNGHISRPKQDFEQTLRKTVESKSPQKNQKNTKSNTQNPTSELPTKANSAQSHSTLETPITHGILVKDNATKIEPKSGGQIAQLIVNLKNGKSNSIPEQASKSVETKLSLTTSKEQSGLKSVLPDTFNEQHKLHTSLSNISKGISPTDIQPGQSKHNNKIASNGAVVATKNPTDVENTKALISDAFVDTKDNKNVTKEKTFILGTSIVAGNTKNPPSNDQKVNPETIVGDGDKTTKEGNILTDKFVIDTDEKTHVLNTNSSQVQNKITDQNSQPTKIVPENSVLNPNIKDDSRTTDSEIISESSDINNKETSNSGHKTLEKSAVQKLNITNVQVPAAQTKNNNGSTSNNTNSELEQSLTHNNPEIPITDQLSSSTKGAKALDIPSQTSPNNVSADVSKQILESIHSSISQEGRNQQITVQLNPPELGKVLIKFQEQDQDITGLLEVSKTQTRIEIEQAIPQIVRDLQNSGIQIKRLDIVLSQEEQQGQEALRDQTLQNGWTQQQGSADSYSGGNNPDTDEINEWLINNKTYRNISEAQESYITNGSINLLI